MRNGDLAGGAGEPPEGSGAIRDGARFGDLTLLRELGRGSQGIVYEAHQASLDRTVAVKILPKDVSFTEEQSERFRREAEAAGRLSHPNVVAVYGLTESHGHLLISQELVTGGSLQDAIDERTHDGHKTNMGDCAWAAGICKLLAEGLQHAHTHGIVHRDIKPGNALLNEHGVPKITDFGLAKVEDKLGLSTTGALMGTPHYMSPEQVQAVKDSVGPASDIYSLGAVLYRMLTGRVPFTGESLQKVFLDILTRAPASPRKLQSGVSPDLEAVCLKALEKEPDDRYHSAQDFADDLDRYLAGQPTLARPVGPVGRAARSLKRLATSTLAVVALLVPTLWVAVDALQLRGMAARNADVHFARLGVVALCTLLLAWPLALLGVRLAHGRGLGALPAWALTLALGGAAGWGVLDQRTTQLHMAARAELSDRLDLENVGNVRTIDDLHAYVAGWDERFDAEDFRLVARGFLKRERPALAADWALRAEAAEPDNPVTYAVLLAVFHALGRDGEAAQAELSMNTLAEETNDWRAWQQVGDILRDMRRYESAREAYQKASYRPLVDRDLMNLKLAQISAELCDWNQAAKKLDQFIEFKPKDLAANVLAFHLASKGIRIEKPEQPLTLDDVKSRMKERLGIIEASPLATTDMRLAYGYEDRGIEGRQQENLERMRQVVSDPEADDEALAWWAYKALELGRQAKGTGKPEQTRECFEDAERGYGKLVAHDADSLLGHLGSAAAEIQLAAYERGDARLARLDRARQHAETAVALDPYYAEGHVNLGLAKLQRAFEEAGVYDYPLQRIAEKLSAVPAEVMEAYVRHASAAVECNGLDAETLNDSGYTLGIYGSGFDKAEAPGAAAGSPGSGDSSGGRRGDLELGLQYAERSVKLMQAARAGGNCSASDKDLHILGMAYDTLAELQDHAGDDAAALQNEQRALEQEPDKNGPHANYYRSRIERIQAKIAGSN